MRWGYVFSALLAVIGAGDYVCYDRVTDHFGSVCPRCSFLISVLLSEWWGITSDGDSVPCRSTTPLRGSIWGVLVAAVAWSLLGNA
ncbi:hypothetical protein KCP73_11795 [Salmonella enterica subsp. enterica]|nr:hypothetical protein KCP73_11795 [Salmonella enterica subsp. enterica]